MRAHASLRLGPLRGTTPELLASPWYGAWGFCVVWEAGLPHKTSSPPTQRRNGRACSSLTARGGGLPVGGIDFSQATTPLPCHPHRLPTRFGQPGRIEHQHPIALAQVPRALASQLLSSGRIVPRVPTNEALQRQARLAKTIGNRCDVFAFDV